MKSKNSNSKRIISAGLALVLLINTACGVRPGRSSTIVRSFLLERYVQDDAGTVRGDVNPVEPVLVDNSTDSDGNQSISFEVPEHSGAAASGGNSSDSDDENENDTQDDADEQNIPRGLPRIYAELNIEGENLEQQREYLRGHAQRLAEAREACRALNCEGIPGLDQASPGAIRVGRDGFDPSSRNTLKTKEDVLKEIERLENALKAQRAEWEKIRAAAREKKARVEREHQEIAASVVRAIDEAEKSAQENNALSESIQSELIQNHNSKTENIYKEFGLDPHQGSNDANSGAQLSRPATPYEAEVERLKQANTLLRTTSVNTELNDSASMFAEMADASARRGNLESYDIRLSAARAFAWASQHKGNTDENAIKAALDLSVGAKSLESQGMSQLADDSARVAKTLLQVALDVARLSKVIDVPLNVLEAFSGKTLDFTPEGQVFLRDCSALERGFAIGSLVLGTGGVLLGAAPIAIAAGVASKVLNAFKEQSAAVHGAAAGARIFDETVAVAREIERTAPKLMADATLTAYGKKHIWFGEIRVSQDKLKVRIDGGLHTHDGLQKYLAQAPVENVPVSREMLPNGVERVVFPESALTGREARKLSLAAEKGFGKANGKTLFPSHWTPETIENAARKASIEGKVVSVTDKGSKREVLHEGITVIVNFGNDGRPKSAFPSWNQGEFK